MIPARYFVGIARFETLPKVQRYQIAVGSCDPLENLSDCSVAYAHHD